MVRPGWGWRGPAAQFGDLRSWIKPGITGWAQVCGWRGETDELWKMEMRVQHDLYYIENWSLGFDLYIILMTIFRLRTPQAY